MTLDGSTGQPIAARDRPTRARDGRSNAFDEPMGNVRAVENFLLSTEELASKDKTVKITISMTKLSVDFFKKEAELHNTQYQKMIRTLLGEYIVHQW